MNSEKKILFSVTANECRWAYTKGTGSGGQKKNKTSSAVHCNHDPSGGRGYAEDSRSQADNKRLAFERMIATKEFKKWHHMEIMKRTGMAAQAEEYVAQELRKIKVEVKDDDGRWVEIDKDQPLE